MESSFVPGLTHYRVGPDGRLQFKDVSVDAHGWRTATCIVNAPDVIRALADLLSNPTEVIKEPVSFDVETEE